MTSKKIGDFLKNIIVLIIRMIVTNPKVLMTDMLIFVTNATISTSIDDSTAIPKAITTLPIKIDKYRAIAMTITTTITILTMKLTIIMHFLRQFQHFK